MIRINLLGGPKGKAKRTPAMGQISGTQAPRMAILTVVIVALALGANLFYYWQLQRSSEKVTKALQDASRENQRLSEVKQRYLELERQKDNYKRRVDVIDQLRNNQAGPVNLLAMVGDTVNDTEAVWLNTLKDEGGSISVEGTALSVKAVANLMANLKKSGAFRNVEIKESYQDDTVKEMQAFIFTLTCEKQPQKNL